MNQGIPLSISRAMAVMAMLALMALMAAGFALLASVT